MTVRDYWIIVIVMIIYASQLYGSVVIVIMLDGLAANPNGHKRCWLLQGASP